MVSEKPWRIDAVARLFLGVIISVCFGMLAAGLLDSKKLNLSADQIQFLQMTILIISFQGAALIWTTFFLRESKISWGDAFGLRPASRFKAITAGMCVGVLVLPAAWAMQLLSEMAMERLKIQPVAQAAVEELEKASLSTTQIVVFGVFTILLAPIAEEALFRGILYPTIKQMGYPRLALWGSSILFGIMHFNMVAMVPLILLAAVLVLLYEASGSLLTPIATHSMFNAANFFYLLFGDAIQRRFHLP
jgi:membrane protease YdiL (CAAX protease family)